jgi:hypothetical protein
MRVTPVKSLMRSTTIYEIITRGSFFAVNLQTGALTVLPYGADGEQHAVQEKNQMVVPPSCRLNSSSAASTPHSFAHKEKIRYVVGLCKEGPKNRLTPDLALTMWHKGVPYEEALKRIRGVLFNSD